MGLENEVVVAAPAASEPVVTATPATEVVAPVVAETPKEPVVETPKTFTQEELDAAVGKRLARERRAWERDQATRAEEQARAAQIAAGAPQPENYTSAVEYAEALATHKAEIMVIERERHRQASATESEYHGREEEARTKYTDFDQVAHNPQLRITQAMAESIRSSEVGPEVAYFLGTNPKEADRISQLHPLTQAREIGRIEAKLIADPPSAKKASKAPAPISPVTPRSNQTNVYDTTDPRSIATMTTSEWIDAERRRQVKKQEAMGRV
jgi:hypothetical protein